MESIETMWTALAKIAQESGPEARQRPRFKANQMVVDHGAVLDFSATGLRIMFHRRVRFEVGQIAELTLQNPQGERRCCAEVMWIRKESRKMTEVGFRFIDAQTAEQMQLFKAAFDPLGDGEWSNR